MCTSPLKVINPTRRFFKHATKAFIQVPCGQCPDCRSSQAADWFIRCKQEIDDCLSAGGLVVFMSPTYKPEYRPMFRTEIDGKVFQFPVFSKEHVQKFMHDIRREFTRHGISESVYHMWCCEYGDGDQYLDSHGVVKYGQYAPHYHALLFFSKEAIEHLRSYGFLCKIWKRKGAFKKGESHKELVEVRKYLKTQQDMKDFCEKFWPYGMIRWSKQAPRGRGIYVNSEFAGEYTTKYVCKDFGFYKHPDVHAFLYDEHEKIIKSRYEMLKDKLPKHWQRHGFGKGLLAHVLTNPVRAFSDGLSFDDLDLRNGKKQIYSVPRYIELKALYHWKKETREYVLNDLGREVKSALYDIKIEKQAQKFKTDMMPFSFDTHNIDYGVHSNKIKKSGLSFSAYLQSLLAGRSYQELAIYNSVWNGRVCDSTDIAVLDSLGYADFIAFSKDKYLDDLYTTHCNGYNTAGYFKSKPRDELNAIKTFSLCKRFRGFDEIIDLLNSVRNYKRSEQQLAYLHDRVNRLNLKQQIYAV